MRFFLLSAVLVLLPVQAAFAHEPAGTPKNHCEHPSEWREHDYTIDPPQLAVDPLGVSTLVDRKVRTPFYDGNYLDDCDGDLVPADYDGHHELGIFAFALLSVESGDGVHYGSIACWEEPGHHLSFGPVSVVDVAFGPIMAFTVGADTGGLLPPTDPSAPDCGDFLAERVAWCVESCYVTFPPGVDGAYIVQVGDPAAGWAATEGHVYS